MSENSSKGRKKKTFEEKIEISYSQLLKLQKKIDDQIGKNEARKLQETDPVVIGLIDDTVTSLLETQKKVNDSIARNRQLLQNISSRLPEPAISLSTEPASNEKIDTTSRLDNDDQPISEQQQKIKDLEDKIVSIHKKRSEIIAKSKDIKYLSTYNSDPVNTPPQFTRLDHVYNPNTKYGRRKARQQAMYNYEHMSTEDKLKVTPYVIIVIIGVILFVCLIVWLCSGTEGLIKYLTH